jgi:hypothetical protein
VVGLDYRDPFLDPHGLFQQYKEHPFLRAILEGGKLVRYGARTISEGGWYSIPRPYADGVLLAGEAAGYLNAMRLKGVHLAIKTGMLAAETALEALAAGDTSASKLGAFAEKVERRTSSGSCGRCATSTRASSTGCGRAWSTADCRCSPAAAGSSTRCSLRRATPRSTSSPTTTAPARRATRSGASSPTAGARSTA